MDDRLRTALEHLVRAEGALRCRFEPTRAPGRETVRFRRVLCADPEALERVLLTLADLTELERLGLVRPVLGGGPVPRPFTLTDLARGEVSRRGPG